MKQREEGIQRLHPAFWNPRWYYLIQLRKLVEGAVHEFLQKKQDLNLADFGCGNRPYKPVVAPFIRNYIGIDLEENPRADMYISPEGHIQMPDSTVDVVLSTQVLEHVVNPVLYLSEARRILKPGGLLILTTHGYWMFHPDPTDYWRWTSAGLRKIVAEGGFEVVHFRGIMGRAAMGVQLFQDGFLFKIPRFARPFLALLMQPLVALFDHTTSQQSKDADACTYIIVAKAVK